MEILRFDELPHSNNSIEFEGADHSGAGVSFFIVDAAPGRRRPFAAPTVGSR